MQSEKIARNIIRKEIAIIKQNREMPPKIEGKVTPEVLQTIYLDEITSRLADIQTTVNMMAQPKKPVDDKKRKPRIRHIPYNIRRTVGADGRRTEQIKNDTSRGLGTAGRAGYIYNDGPGSIQIKIFDGTEWSDWMTIASGDGINFYYEDNIQIERMKVKVSKTLSTTYELTMNPGLEKGE